MCSRLLGDKKKSYFLYEPSEQSLQADAPVRYLAHSLSGKAHWKKMHSRPLQKQLSQWLNTIWHIESGRRTLLGSSSSLECERQRHSGSKSKGLSWKISAINKLVKMIQLPLCYSASLRVYKVLSFFFIYIYSRILWWYFCMPSRTGRSLKDVIMTQ